MIKGPKDSKEDNHNESSNNIFSAEKEQNSKEEVSSKPKFGFEVKENSKIQSLFLNSQNSEEKNHEKTDPIKEELKSEPKVEEIKGFLL